MPETPRRTPHPLVPAAKRQALAPGQPAALSSRPTTAARPTGPARVRHVLGDLIQLTDGTFCALLEVDGYPLHRLTAAQQAAPELVYTPLVARLPGRVKVVAVPPERRLQIPTGMQGTGLVRRLHRAWDTIAATVVDLAGASAPRHRFRLLVAGAATPVELRERCAGVLRALAAAGLTGRRLGGAELAHSAQVASDQNSGPGVAGVFTTTTSTLSAESTRGSGRAPAALGGKTAARLPAGGAAGQPLPKPGKRG